MIPKITEVGIIQFDNERYGFRPIEVSHDLGSDPVVKGYLMPMFGANNRLAANRFNPEIKRVIFNAPATIVIWSDGSKTVVKCQPGDDYSEELGLAMCIAKKYLGNQGNFNKVFKKWLAVDDIPVEKMREKLSRYCDKFHNCGNCPLHSPVCRCGCGTYFDDRNNDGSYNMTDDEIREAYRIAFRK